MPSTSPPIPSIRITPAPPVKAHAEPYFPVPHVELDAADDGCRAKWLSLPPLASSSLRPADCPPHKGLGQDQFNSFLKVSPGQGPHLGMQKKLDLPKELAFRSQGLKQLEQRARCLSKVAKIPCTATISTSIESPAIVHHSVSAPGFEFKLPALEVAAENAERDEHIGRGPLIDKQPLTSPKLSSTAQKSKRVPPSLDEITAHLKPVHISSIKVSRSRLPSFLKALNLPPGSTGDQIEAVPVRSLALNADATSVQPVIRSQHPDPCTLKLGSRRAVIPRTINVVAGSTLHTSRADAARDMIATLGRRGSPPPDLGHHECTRTITETKRCSIPAKRRHSIGFGRVAVSRGGL